MRPFRFVRRRTRGAARRLSALAVERRHGVETRRRVFLEDIGMHEENRFWYAPSDWLAVKAALNRLDVTPDDVFADYGCGAGRVVITAAEFPFKRVIGLELTSELTARARSNLERNRGTIRAGSVELVTTDATVWDVPQDLTVAYFFCPFVGPPFAAVIERLIASVDEHPRPVRIVYNLPVEHSFLIRTGRVHVVDASPNLWLSRSRRGPMTIVTYLILPQDGALRADYVARFPQRLDDAEVWLDEYEPGYVLDKPERLGGRYLERPRLLPDDAR